MNKNSSLSVQDVMEARVESFTNSVAEQQRETRVQFLDGFIWNLAEPAKTKIMHTTTSSLNFENILQNAFYSSVKFKGLICWLNFDLTKKE